jgi:hypothetical protein
MNTEELIESLHLLNKFGDELTKDGCWGKFEGNDYTAQQLTD